MSNYVHQMVRASTLCTSKVIFLYIAQFELTINSHDNTRTALILRHQGRIEESLTAFQAALYLNPMNVNNMKQVGRSLYLLGKHKTALGEVPHA